MDVAEEVRLKDKIAAQLSGQPINTTENRSVLHTALRKDVSEKFMLNGKNIMADIKEVRDRIDQFSDKIRQGVLKGHSGKAFKNVVCIGIGGSFLGPEFVYEAIRNHPECSKASEGMKLRFLANVDPIDFSRATEGLDIGETLFVIVSKTFTTAETMLNARTVRRHILE